MDLYEAGVTADRKHPQHAELGIHGFGAGQRPRADQEPGQYPKSGEGLSCRGLPGAPPHPQSAQEKGAEEHDNADDQQIQQALGDDTHDAEHEIGRAHV